MLDWDKLRIFYAVAQAGSFTRAGETLSISQSAVSRQIGTLEDSLGVMLFHRHARGLILTEQGEILYKTTVDMATRLAMIEGQIQDSKNLPEGPLQITAAEFIGSTWLADKLKDFYQQHPNIQLTLALDDHVLNLGMREADAAIRLYKPEQPDLIQLHLMRMDIGLYAHKDYLEAHGHPQKTRDLKKHTLIGYPEHLPAPYANINHLFRIADVDPDQSKNILMMNSVSGLLQLVRAGLGIAALPSYLVKDDPLIESVLPDDRQAPIDMYFVYPEERRHAERIKIFRDFLLKYTSAKNYIA